MILWVWDFPFLSVILSALFVCLFKMYDLSNSCSSTLWFLEVLQVPPPCSLLSETRKLYPNIESDEWQTELEGEMSQQTSKHIPSSQSAPLPSPRLYSNNRNDGGENKHWSQVDTPPVTTGNLRIFLNMDVKSINGTKARQRQEAYRGGPWLINEICRHSPRERNRLWLNNCNSSWSTPQPEAVPFFSVPRCTRQHQPNICNIFNPLSPHQALQRQNLQGRRSLTPVMKGWRPKKSRPSPPGFTQTLSHQPQS